MHFYCRCWASATGRQVYLNLHMYSSSRCASALADTSQEMMHRVECVLLESRLARLCHAGSVPMLGVTEKSQELEPESFGLGCRWGNHKVWHSGKVVPRPGEGVRLAAQQSYGSTTHRARTQAQAVMVMP